MDCLTLGAIAVAGVGLWFNWYGIHRGNHNSSATSIITLNEAWRQAWERFLRAEDEAVKQYQFAELLNLLEIACALRIRNVLTGVSRELLTEYLDDVMRLLNTSDDAKGRLEALIHSKTTFKYLRLYLKYLRKHPRRTGHR